MRAPKLKIGIRMLSETVCADAREGDIGMQLGEIAKANPAVAIGSYPFFDPQHGPEYECRPARPRCTEACASQTCGRGGAGASAVGTIQLNFAFSRRKQGRCENVGERQQAPRSLPIAVANLPKRDFASNAAQPSHLARCPVSTGG